MCFQLIGIRKGFIDTSRQPLGLVKLGQQQAATCMLVSSIRCKSFVVELRPSSSTIPVLCLACACALKSSHLPLSRTRQSSPTKRPGPLNACPVVKQRAREESHIPPAASEREPSLSRVPSDGLISWIVCFWQRLVYTSPRYIFPVLVDFTVCVPLGIVLWIRERVSRSHLGGTRRDETRRARKVDSSGAAAV